ncbi:MAG: DUF1080 domain-containing protein [Phycisphaerales bacterium]|nr:MAG: DUF1080 domain-containing protein [Phycisphaerales bacterium]
MNKLTAISTLVFVLALAAGPAPAAETEPQASDDGFVSLFNGKDLTGWDGDSRLWSAKDGAIRGQTTEENPTKGNTFCIWRGGTLKNFILRMNVRIQNGNSGIQYRSKEVGKWVISGYQAEVANGRGSAGFLYHEKGRASLVRVGDFVVIDEKGQKNIVGKVADRNELLKAPYYRDRDWNQYVIIARGNHIVHYLNGLPTIELIDNDRLTKPDDPKDRRGAALEGLLALQIHAGPPMVVEFKDIYVKHLPENYGRAVTLFNGNDLTGWTPSSDALKDTFGVRNGVMTDTGRPAGYIRTKKDYANYVLRLQMRHVKPGNSGVLVRVVGPDKVWPKSIEAQGASGNMGDIWNIDKFPMRVDPKRTRGRRTAKMNPSNEKPTGQWNDYEIHLNGGDLRIYVNSMLQNMATEVEEVPGKIALQSEGSPKEFRNIVLVPINR